MIRKPSRSALATISLLCLVLLSACSSGNPILQSVEISPKTASIDAAINSTGNTQQYTATGTYSDGTQKDVTSTTSWASSNSGVVAINASGLATAATPPDTATVTITGSIGGSAATATLTVVHPIQSIAVTPATKSIPLGLKQQYVATGTYLNQANVSHTEDVSSVATWLSSTPATATVNATGLATSAAVGTTNITAGIGTIVSPNAVLTVTAAVVTGLQVSPAGPTIALGNSGNLTALELKTDGTTAPLTGTVTWATSACTPAGAVLIAASGVNGNESISGQAAGACTATATEGALTGATTVTVVTGSTHFAYVANNSDSSIGGYAVTASASTPLVPLTPPTTSVSTAQQAVLHTNGKYLYLIDVAGNVHVYTVNATSGALTLPAEPSPLPNVSSAGETFNYGVVDPTGRFFYAIDFDGQAIHSAPISTVDGRLGTVSTTGGVDFPDFIAIDHQGKYAYVVSRNDTLYAFAINQTNGMLTPLSTPSYATGGGPLAVTIDPTDKFVYVANAFDNSVDFFALDKTTGLLTPGTSLDLSATALFVSNVIVDPSSKYLYILDSGDPGATTPINGSVYAYNIGTNGAIGSAIGTPVPTELNPFGIAIDPTGTLLATDNNESNSISLFTVGAGGALTAKTPATVATGNAPLWVTFYNAP